MIGHFCNIFDPVNANDWVESLVRKKLPCFGSSKSGSDNDDCSGEKACLDAKYIDPFSLPNACGAQARCSVQDHIGV
ncbi:uncharacterized protein LOC119545961 isoform X2 [Drosophila subpulchrella]|uniref:uncharacterized protein LOC119545961 isoform X2 n=1 Tax=Drosophila subpulchrella TaxID=1486046 RepID=UPI0018A13479|nr:uncharacterized protein LOC119545961 isoform X2 [Drosophila subpulchrella]